MQREELVKLERPQLIKMILDLYEEILTKDDYISKLELQLLSLEREVKTFRTAFDLIKLEHDDLVKRFENIKQGYEQIKQSESYKNTHK